MAEGDYLSRPHLGNPAAGRGGIARALYVTATGRRVVILRVFVKKTQKTPRREIELARQRAREVIREGRSSWSRSPLPPRVRTRPTHNALEDEFSLAKAMIEAPAHASLTQQLRAERRNLTQVVIARLESGCVKPSTRTRVRLAVRS